MARTRDLLALGAGVALATSLVELVILAVRKFGQHKELLLSPHTVWMAPAGDLAIFILPLLAILAVVRGQVTPTVARVTQLGLTVLSATAIVLMFPQVHRLAALILAVGVALSVVRVVPVDSPRFRRLAWLATAMTTVIVAAVTIVTTAWWTTRGHSPSTSAPRGAPNVLLIVWDTVRAANLRLHGYARPTTPNLEKLAARGMVFDRAIATTSWTLPSHASMFTGRFVSEMTAGYHTPLDRTYVTLAEALRDRGYATAGFVGNTFYAGFEFGLDRGFVHYDDYPVSFREVVISTSLGRALVTSGHVRKFVGRYDVFGRRSAKEISTRFLDWLPRSGHRPFFAFLNYFDAHEPYLPPAPWDRMFGFPAFRHPDRYSYRQLRTGAYWDRSGMPENERGAEQAAYDASIAYLDGQLGELLAELKNRGLADKTVVIVTSDHGEFHGEHGRFGHGTTVYAPVVHVPLVIAAPGIQEGAVVREPVSLRNIAATVMDLTGFGAESEFPGLSLAKDWRIDASGRVSRLLADTVLAEFEEEDARSVFVGRHHLIVTEGAAPELYDHVSDPMEEQDLADTSAGRAIVAELTARYRDLFARPWMRDPREPPPQRPPTKRTRQ
jgi:arylsulfatase A-like enzyme